MKFSRTSSVLSLLFILLSVFSTGTYKISHKSVKSLKREWPPVNHPRFVFVTIPAFAIRCYQCSSATDMKGVDSCGAYKAFNRTQHIAIECNSDESHMPGSFCMKVVNQSPRGFICECFIDNVRAWSDVESFQGMVDGDRLSDDVPLWPIQALLESVIGASMKMACIGRSVTVLRTRVIRDLPQ